MPAYVISDVRMKDASAMALYRERAASSIARYGGRYVYSELIGERCAGVTVQSNDAFTAKHAGVGLVCGR